MDDVAIVERQLGRPPRAFRRVAVRCPFGLPAVAEQRPFDDDGRAVPDAVLAHLRAPRDAAVAARGRRRRHALDAGGRGRRRAARQPRARARRAAGAPAGAAGRDRRREPHRQHQVPARARGLRARAARATSSGRASSPRPLRSGRRAAAARLYDRAPMDVELARQQWEDGRRRVERSLPGRPESRRLAATSTSSSPSSASASGRPSRSSSSPRPTTTRASGRATLLYDARPEDASPPDTSTVTDAAFQLYARGALDYRP